MPTVKKRFMSLKKDRPRKDPKVLTELRYKWLISEMLEFIGEENPFSSKQDEETCYETNKDIILERWLSDPHHYCTRPKCFHWFEELSPKQIVGEEKWFNCIGHNPGKWESEPVLEFDHQWLHRLGLLQEKELSKYHKMEQETQNKRARMFELGLFFPAETNTTKKGGDKDERERNLEAT